ncbi:MAG: hypothetical protein N3G77_06940 [Nitrososphaeria archaeon]|nr:hypothetical protein [Nitrososphaeria archaeon]
MIPRRKGFIDVSQLEECVKRYLEFNPQLLERRQHYALVKVLDFLKKELNVPSVQDVLGSDVKTVTSALQK